MLAGVRPNRGRRGITPVAMKTTGRAEMPMIRSAAVEGYHPKVAKLVETPGVEDGGVVRDDDGGCGVLRGYG